MGAGSTGHGDLRRTLAALILFLVLVPQESAAAEDPVDASGYRWGMSKDEFIRQIGSPASSRVTPAGEQLVYFSRAPNGLVEGNYEFMDGVLVQFVYILDIGLSGYRDAVRENTATHGSPASCSPQKGRSQSCRWELRKSRIDIAVFRSSVMIGYVDQRKAARYDAAYKTWWKSR